MRRIDSCLRCGRSIAEDLPPLVKCQRCEMPGAFCDECSKEPVCGNCLGGSGSKTVTFPKQPIVPSVVCQQPPEPGTLYISLTCDWEGRPDIDKYYQDMRRLRQEIGRCIPVPVPITHFITPRSYDNKLRQMIAGKEAVLPIDEIGLHIHCWSDLLKECNPELLGELAEIQKVHQETAKGEGKDTPLVCFSRPSILAIVDYCHQKLARISGVKAVSFRGGAWYCSDVVYDALSRVGVTIDSSPIPLSLIKYVYKPGEDLMKGLWGASKQNFGNAYTAARVPGAITCETQPYNIVADGGGIKVFPMTWGMDVNTPPENFEVWLAAETRKVLDGADRFVNFGFHDTLIQRNFVLPALTVLFKGMSATWETHRKFKFRFVTMQDAAAAAKV
jgi:hypothetical protein